MSTDEHERQTTAAFPTMNEKVNAAPNSPQSSVVGSTAVASSTASVKGRAKRAGRRFSGWRKGNGERVAIFGPEKVVEDEYIKVSWILCPTDRNVY